MKDFKAINSKYQSQLNRIYIADRKYSQLLEDMDHQCNQPDSEFISEAQLERLENQATRRSENAYDKLLEKAEGIPAREAKNFNQQYETEHGYDSYAF